MPDNLTYAGTVARREGTGQNPRSTAFGVGQFVAPTWMAYAKAHPEVFQGKSPEETLAMRSDPNVAMPAIQWLGQQNAQMLQKYGVQPTGQALSIAHYLGGYPATQVMKAPNDAKLSDVLTSAIGPDMTAQFIKANPELGTLTAGALKQRYLDTPDPTAGTTPGNMGVANANLPVPPIPPTTPPPPVAPAGGQPSPNMNLAALAGANVLGGNPPGGSLGSMFAQAAAPIQRYNQSFFDPSNAQNV